MSFRAVDKKTVGSVVAEWDALAPVRYEQITSGRDVTYCRILIPNIIRLITPLKPKAILDAGCGVGLLAEHLRALAPQVVGIDPSAKGIAIAQANCKEDIEFLQLTMEAYAEKTHQSFDVVIANMVLMDVLDLSSFLNAVSKVLRPNGALIFSCTHPWFWPSYYGYGSASWFQYDREIVIESPFRISADSECVLVSTHVHRSLEIYVSAFQAAGLFLKVLREPMPSPEINTLYPQPWKYPRYIIGVCNSEPERMRHIDLL
jgi:SAM-dependent methyltransferase